MKKLKRLFWLSVSVVTLSLAGCATNCVQPEPELIPSLPESVVNKAQSPLTISNEVQSWRQDVLKSFQSSTKP